MDPMTASLLLSGVGNAAQIGYGISQMFTEKPEAPKFEIPSEVRSMKELALDEMSRTRIPGQSAMEERLAGSTAQRLNALKESAPGGNVGAIGDAARDETNALTRLAIEAGNQRRAGVGMLRDALGFGAQMKEKQFAVNELYPYRTELQNYYNDKYAGPQNIMGGLTNASSNFMSASNLQQSNELMREIYGLGGDQGGNQSTPVVNNPASGVPGSIIGSTAGNAARNAMYQQNFSSGINPSDWDPIGYGAAMLANAAMREGPGDYTEIPYHQQRQERINALMY